MKVCIVLDSEFRKWYEHEELKNLWRSHHEISLVLVESGRSSGIRESLEEEQGNPRFQKHSFLTQLKTKKSGWIARKWFVLLDIEEWIAERLKPSTSHRSENAVLNRRVSVLESVPGLDVLGLKTFEPVKVEKGKYDFGERTLKQISECSDVVVFLGFNKRVTGRILHCTRFGVLSFHHADIQRYRGRPAGFREWINNEKCVGTSLQQLNEALDAGTLVVQKFADISQVRCYQQVELEAMKLKGNMLVEGLGNLESSCDLPAATGRNMPFLSTTRNSNRFLLVVKCALKNMRRRYFQG